MTRPGSSTITWGIMGLLTGGARSVTPPGNRPPQCGCSNGCFSATRTPATVLAPSRCAYWACAALNDSHTATRSPRGQLILQAGNSSAIRKQVGTSATRREQEDAPRFRPQNTPVYAPL